MERVRYICSICDHELVARGFCPSCKKMIKEPVLYKGGYLPNEDNHNYVLNRKSSGREGYRIDNTNSQVKYKTNALQSGSISHASDSSTDYGNCGGHRDSDYGVPNVDPHSGKKKNKGRLLGYIIFIYILMYVLQFIFSSFD